MNDICDFCSKEIDCVYCEYCFDEEYIPPRDCEMEIYLEKKRELDAEEETQ